MIQLISFLQSRLAESRDDRGATMVEYGIMVALIAVVSIVIIGVLGGQVQAAFQAISDALP
jgi:pilus assembly protein Flp/PilA